MQPSGIFLMDKRAGFSSAQAIAFLKRRLDIKKIGHAGTLDPFATGLLVCLVNSATKLADQFQAGIKTYSGVIKLGLVTDTDDITGNILSESQDLPTEQAIISAAESFRGTFKQTPPRVSAIKVDGVRAYKLQREGKEFELKERETEVFSSEFELLGPDSLRFKLVSAKGFYVRSFARDLGEKLACGATLSELRRDGSHPFSVDMANFSDSISWADLIDPQSLLGEKRV